MVAMNPQTWDKDVAGIEPGGYLFYNSTKPMPASKFRDDITVIGVPLTEICNARIHRPAPAPAVQEHHLCRRAGGAARHRLPASSRQLLARAVQGQGKADRRQHRTRCISAIDYAREHSTCPIGLRVQRTDEVGDRIFIDGNAAAALGCVYGGATVAPGIRSRPSSSLAEAFARYCGRYRVDPETGEHRYAIIQAEDELASIGMVIGAGWNGARAFTATSGPGISLMQEFIGLAYFAEIPAVIFDVQRGGPSTGMPTRTQQSDMLSCAYASHGDTKHVLLLPGRPARMLRDSPSQAFDLADRLQTPVFVMLDLDIGMNERLCAPFTWDDTQRHGPRQGDDRGGARSRQGFRPLSRRRWRRHSVPHLSRHASDARLLLHARHSRRTATPATPRKARPMSTTWSGCCASSRRRSAWCRAPIRRDAAQAARGSARSITARPARRWSRRSSCCAAQGIALDLLRVRGFPFHDEVLAFVEEHDRRLRRRAEPRRAAAHAARQRVRDRSGEAHAACCIMTARRSPRASSPTRSASASMPAKIVPLRKAVP